MVDGPLRPIEESEPHQSIPQTLPPDFDCAAAPRDGGLSGSAADAVRSAQCYERSGALERVTRALYQRIAAHTNSSWLLTTPNLQLHIVLGSQRVLYPINVLRNVGTAHLIRSFDRSAQLVPDV